MKILELGLPQIDGQEVQPEAALAFIDERELLEVIVIDGESRALFKMIVNPGLIRATDIELYQSSITDLALESEALETEGARLQAIAESKEQAPLPPVETQSEGEVEGEQAATQTAIVPFQESVDPELTRETLAVVNASLSLSRRMTDAKARLLVKSIEAWNIPAVQPSVELLTQRTGIGPAALAVLEKWFFPTSPPVGAEIGETETPSSENTSAGSEQTPGEENTPATS